VGFAFGWLLSGPKSKPFWVQIKIWCQKRFLFGSKSSLGRTNNEVKQNRKQIQLFWSLKMNAESLGLDRKEISNSNWNHQPTGRVSNISWKESWIKMSPVGDMLPQLLNKAVLSKDRAEQAKNDKQVYCFRQRQSQIRSENFDLPINPITLIMQPNWRDNYGKLFLEENNLQPLAPRFGWFAVWEFACIASTTIRSLEIPHPSCNFHI